jgi:anaerobic magnesium-protoporphyrin IX monomethyl ester cyclase
MRVLLVGPDLEENLSLRYLASSLRAAGHEPQIAAFESASDSALVVAAASDVDLVGLSMCYQVRAGEYLALARSIKQAYPERRVIAGGHFASCAARDLLDRHPELDLIVIHEGEETIAQLASLAGWTDAALAKIPGLVHRHQGGLAKTEARPALADLDRLPWPDRSGPARLMAGVPTAYMMGSRGCLSACDYCCISTMHRMVSGKRFRQRSPEDIVEEMAFLYHDRGVRQFVFHDDNFLVPQIERNLERIEALDRAMRTHRMRRVALALKCRPADVNREVFLRLREMGLLRVFLGIESGSRAGLESIGRQQTVADEHRALRIVEELGISTQYTIIMFHPEATLQSMREDLDFVSEHAAHPMSYCRAEIYAGTPLEQRMLRASRAYGNYLARAYHYADPVTQHAWDATWSLLARRCFVGEHLQGQVVRLDHQAAVLQHFYDGRAVDALVADFAAFELEVNRETVQIMREIFALCEAHPDPESTSFREGYETLREQEQCRCELLLRRACALRDAIRERSLGTLGLARSPGGSLLERLPRHAAAVFLAVGLLNCNSKDALRTGHDAATDGTQQKADTLPAGDVATYRDQGGMMEAPPPRLDAPNLQQPDVSRADLGADLGPDASSGTKPEVGRDTGGDGASDGRRPDLPSEAGKDAGVSEAGALDTGRLEDVRPVLDTAVFKDQGGMIEAPPPRLDAPVFRDQGGMVEAPPPRLDAPIVKTDAS